MSLRERSPFHWPKRSVVLPFFAFAYPLVFLLFQGGSYCEPLCFRPTPAGVVQLVGIVLVVLLGAFGVAFVLRVETGGGQRRVVTLLFAPPRLAIAILLSIFAAFVSFLAMDALSLAESVWKPLVLPASVPLFFPVWALYLATFPVAVVFSLSGIQSTQIVTLVVRGFVVFLGFPLSVALQTLVVSFVVEAFGLDSTN